MLGYRVPAPDEAMLISGGRSRRDGAPFRVVTGHGAFVMPFFRRVGFLTLAMQESEVAEQCVTRQGMSLHTRPRSTRRRPRPPRPGRSPRPTPSGT